jgi:hypothetical protein
MFVDIAATLKVVSLWGSSVPEFFGTRSALDGGELTDAR